jgi:hypothetical protein
MKAARSSGPPRLSDATGLSGMLAAVSVVLLALTVCGAVRAGFVPPLVERMVCVVSSVLPTGPKACGEPSGGRLPADAGGLLHRVQQPAERPNRPGLDELFRRLQGSLNRYFEAVPGSQHRRPRARIHGPPGEVVNLGFVELPPAPGASDGTPVIDLFVRDTGDPRSDLAEARFALAYLFARINLHDFGAPYDLGDDRLVPSVDGWLCARDCAEWRDLRLRADCMAGAWARWALTQDPLAQDPRIIDEDTVARMRAVIEAKQPYRGPDSGAPDGPTRLRWFDRGYASDQTTPNPFAACSDATS